MTQERIEELMLDSTQLVKDVGTLLEGEEAVKEGLIDACLLYTSFGAELERTAISGDYLIQYFQKCCLSGSVVSDDGNVFPTLDLKADILK